MGVEISLPRTNISDQELENSYLIPDYSLHLFPDETVLFPPEGRRSWGYIKGKSHPDNPHFPNNYNESESQRINETAGELMQLIDGRTKGIDIYRQLLKKYDEPWGTHQDAIYTMLKTGVKRRLLSLSPDPVQKDLTITGSREVFFPRALSLEVTQYCQFECVHCYGNYSSENNMSHLNGAQLIRILEKFKKLGACRVQLTGGECTAHPDFEDILSFCTDNYPSRVSVITNAYKISEKAFEILITNSIVVNISISINGDESHHDRFVNRKGSFKRAVSAINRLAKGGVHVLVPINLVPFNYHLMEKAADIAVESGAADVAYPFAMERGRARGTDLYSGLTGDVETMKYIGEATKRVQKKYPFLTMAKPFREGEATDSEFPNALDESHCGAGRRFLAVNASGMLSFCPMTVSEDFSYGNVIESNLEDLMKSDIVNTIFNVERPGKKYCEDCKHTDFCGSCIAQAIDKFKKDPENCKWGKKWCAKETFGIS